MRSGCSQAMRPASLESMFSPSPKPICTLSEGIQVHWHDEVKECDPLAQVNPVPHSH